MVGKAADWLREERRKVLGDWVAVCLTCGAGRRWFEQFESEVPDACPECGGELLRRCKACGEHEVVLIVTSRLRNLARRLSVPAQHYAAARRLLRDKISKHDIHFSGTGLDLLDHDERDDI